MPFVFLKLTKIWHRRFGFRLWLCWTSHNLDISIVTKGTYLCVQYFYVIYGYWRLATTLLGIGEQGLYRHFIARKVFVDEPFASFKPSIVLHFFTVLFHDDWSSALVRSLPLPYCSTVVYLTSYSDCTCLWPNRKSNLIFDAWEMIT